MGNFDPIAVVYQKEYESMQLTIWMLFAFRICYCKARVFWKFRFLWSLKLSVIESSYVYACVRLPVHDHVWLYRRILVESFKLLLQTIEFSLNFCLPPISFPIMFLHLTFHDILCRLVRAAHGKGANIILIQVIVFIKVHIASFAFRINFNENM